jgi:phage portal protein BeeE
MITMSEWYEMMTYQGMNYQLGGTSTSVDTESIENSFVGYINSLYKTNGIVFACMEARRSVFSEARFQFQRIKNGRPGDLFGSPALSLLEYPWPNGTTGELLSRAIQDVDLTGNHYVAREAGRLRRLRPDWVQIILSAAPDQAVKSDVLGYAYYPGGIGNGSPEIYPVEQIAHWCPIPDPEAQYRGMSWLTPVLREIQSDKEATSHKAKFYANAATPKLAVSVSDTVTRDQFVQFMDAFEAANGGIENAYKTMYLGGGASVDLVGANMVQMDFKNVQGAGETRIAAAAGVPSVVVGFSEGMQGSSLNAGNYKSAKESFGERTLRPLWRSISAAYQTITVMPSSNGTVRLWYDDRDIAFLRTDRLEMAKIQTEQFGNLSKAITSGFTPESSVAAVNAFDLTMLEHTGLVSVQLLPPGTEAPGATPPTGPPVLPPGQPAEPAQANSGTFYALLPGGGGAPKVVRITRHGNKGDPGYSLLHPGSGGGNGIGISVKDHLNESENNILDENISDAFYAGVVKQEYNPFTDPGSHDYDEDEDLEDGQTSVIDWAGLGQFYAAGHDQGWYSNFEGSRRLRRAGNELVGLDQGDHDLLLGSGETNDYDRVTAFGMVLGLATSKPQAGELYRGSYYDGASADDIAGNFTEGGTLDFSLVSFTNSPGVAEYFGDPDLYEKNFGEGTAGGGARLMFTVEPGAQGLLGHPFAEDMKAGDPGTNIEEDEDEHDLVKDDNPDRAREIVTGGRFEIKEVVVDGDTISVRLRQEFTYNPVTGRTT